MFQARNLLKISPSAVKFLSKSRPMVRTLRTSPIPPPNSGMPPPRVPHVRSVFYQYGYSGIVVYFIISTLDLAILFGLVHNLGEKKVIEVENSVKEYFGIGKTSTDNYDKYGGKIDDIDDIGFTKKHQTSNNTNSKDLELDRNRTTLLTEFGIAYTLHRSLFFVRIPLTLAITPLVVKILQRRGYNIGKATTVGSEFGTSATRSQRFGSWFF